MESVVSAPHARRPGFVLTWLSLGIVATVAPGQVPSALRLEPRGVFAEGENTTFKSETSYHFIYDGSLIPDDGDKLDYVIDVDHPDVQAGLMRIHEATTDSFPIKEGGFTWRINKGSGPNPTSGPPIYETPRQHSVLAGAVLFHEHLDPVTRVLTLKYKETRTPATNLAVESHKTYEFWIVGKVLKIHAYADPVVNTRFLDNYDFFQPGVSKRTFGAQEQHIPYMDNTPVIRFNPSTTLPAQTTFYAISDDYFASNGVMAGWSLAPATQNADTWEHWYPLETLQSSLSATTPPYQTLAVPDETLNLIVTSKIEETFTVIPNYRSPYHALTAGRMMIFSIYQAPGSWDSYKRLYDEFKTCGLTDLAIIQYMSKRTGPATVLFPMPANDNSAGVMGCLPMSIHYGTPIQGIYPVDPLNSLNLDAVKQEFGALKDSARNLGALFAATDCESGLDQWGTAEYRLPGHFAVDDVYPMSIPLHVGGWTIQVPTPPSTIDLGLDCSHLPIGFESSWVVRDELGRLNPCWDNSIILAGTSWAQHGFLLGMADARHLYDLVTAQAQYGRDNYRANAVSWDVSHFVPDFYVLDRTYEDPLVPPMKTHTAGDFMKLRTTAARDVRKFVGGPMYGEPNYWRWAQCYDYGARDGFRNSFPTGDSALADDNDNNSLSWVLPDYNLREVLPKASGNCGMGAEGRHMDTVQFPVDDVDGNKTVYLDSYITTSATYGHNGFTTSNGRIDANYITHEGMLRQYAYLGALSRRMAEGKLDTTRYYPSPASSAGFDLSQAIAAGIDLKNPRIQLKFDNGLVFYANHDVQGSSWTIPEPIPTSQPGVFENVVLEPNGFVAGDGTQLFVFFNARPSTYSIPFDYVRYVNRWEMITNRGINTNPAQAYTGYYYGGFPNINVIQAFSPQDLDLFSEASIYVDYRLNVAVGAHGGLWAGNRWLHIPLPEGDSKITVTNFAPIPAPSFLTLLCSSPAIYTNKPEGVVARLTFSNGAWQDVTTLAIWSATNAVVDQSGAVTATTPGPATIFAKYTPPGAFELTDSLPLDVIDGLPSADAGPDLTVYPGTAVSFDASSAVDPKQGPVRCEWDFGDGEKAVGTRVDHVFTEVPTTPRTVALTVRDVEDNLRTDTAEITVNWKGTTRWWDNFDDGGLDGYNPLNGGLWGVRAGRLQQSAPGPVFQQVTIAGPSHVFAASSSGVEFNLSSPSGTNYAGLHVQMANEGDNLDQSGYSARVYGNGLVTLFEPGSGGFLDTKTISGFSYSARHDLRIVVKNLAASALVRAYVDGTKILERNDPSPPPSGYSGLITYDQQARFDDLRITDPQAPYIAAAPLDYSAGAHVSFFIDDQDLFSDISLTDATSMVLTIKAEDGPAAPLLPRVYNGWSGANSLATVATTPTLSYENGSASNSTWARTMMKDTLDATMDSFDPLTKTISYEMIVHDKSSTPKYTRKYARYTRP